jgi:hypothetical protein
VRNLQFFGTGISGTLSYPVPLTDYHGGVHIRLPVFRERPFVPYLAFGLGVVHTPSESTVATYRDASGANGTVQVDVAGGNDFAGNGGAGLRWYINQRFGIRGEAKYYQPKTGPGFGKVEVGFFFQIN